MTFRSALHRSFALIVFLSFLTQHFTVWSAPCSETAGSPCKIVREISQEVLQILGKSQQSSKLQNQDRLKNVWDAMMPHINSCEMAMRSLPADYLTRMTKLQKEEFTDIYSRLLVQSYSLTLGRYTGSKLFRLIFEEERIEGSRARVRSLLHTPKTKYVIAYRLHQQRDKWLIYDVSYNGMSQVDNYRSQLDRVGKKFGYDYREVRNRIRKRLKPSLRRLPGPQIKMRFWGVCQKSP